MAGANIKITSSSSKTDKELKELQRQFRNLQGEFTLTATKAKLFGSETDKLTVKQKELTSKMKIQTSQINIYKEAIYQSSKEINKAKIEQQELRGKIDEVSKAYKESIKNTGKNSEESKKLAKELSDLKESEAKCEIEIEKANRALDDKKKKLNYAETALLKNRSALEEVNKSLSNIKLENFSKTMDTISKKSETMANKLAPAAKVLTGVGVASAGMSISFEDAIAKVSTIADTSEVALDDLTKSIVELSSETGISANEIAQNVYDAISAGQSTGDAVAFVAESTKLAKAGFAEAGQSLDILTTILNAYKMESSEATRVSDILVQTQNKGKVTVGELSQSMGKIIPTAKSVNVNLEQVSAGYALMTSNGIKSAEATTYMSSMLNELGSSGTKTSELLKKETGKSFQQLMSEGKSLGEILNVVNDSAKKNNLSLNDMFGSAEAGKAALILAENAGKDFNNMLGEINQSAGKTDEAYSKVNKTTGQELKKAFNDSKNALIEFGDVLAPSISSVAGVIRTISKVFFGLSDGQKKFIVNAGAFVVATTLGLKGISKLTGGIKEGVKAFKDIKEGVGNVVPKIKEYGTVALEGGKSVVQFTGNIVKSGVQLGIQGVKTGISTGKLIAHKAAVLGVTAATKIMTLAQGALNFVMSLNPITLIIGGLIALSAVFVILYNKCEWFRNGVAAVWTTITNIFSAFDNFLTRIFTTDWTNSFGAFGNILNAFFANCSNIWSSIKGIFKGIVDFVAGVFTGDWSRAWEGIKGIFSNIMNGLGAVIKAPLNAVIGLINMAIDGLNKISFTVPDWVPLLGGKHFGVNLPKMNYLYNGGIITKPTLLNTNTIVGDKFQGQGSQAEAVIPLEVMYRNLRRIIKEESTLGEIILYTTNIFRVDSKEVVKETTKQVIGKIGRSVNNHKKGKGGVSFA